MFIYQLEIEAAWQQLTAEPNTVFGSPFLLTAQLLEEAL
jgi:hypothetical protein